MPELVDLSHAVEDGTVTYPGLPAPAITDFLTREESRRIYAEGTEFHIGRIQMVANTGTYVDSPFHRYAEGLDLAELPLECVANLEGVLVSGDGQATGKSPSPVSTCAGRRCWSAPGGTAIGGRRNISAGTRISRATPPACWPKPVRRWWESIR